MMPFQYKLLGKRVFVAGHNGMVGSAIVRRLAEEACTILTADRSELDLADEHQTRAWLEKNKPDVVIHAAGKVGGIQANNSFPVDFLGENLRVALNVISSSHDIGVERLLFLGSSCIYPKLAKQPIAEEELLAGPLEPTNEWYAVAKIAGLKICQAYRRQYGCDFISAMPTNLFGPRDNYHPEHSHVPAALIQRFHDAKLSNAPSVTIWGSGKPLREFLFVDDLADACIYLLQTYSDALPINIGSGSDLSIREFAEAIADTVGYRGKFIFDTSKPDGTPRKLLDSSRLNRLGWNAKTPLREGLAATYRDFLQGGGRHTSNPIAMASSA